MIAQRYTTDGAQAHRRIKACERRTTITETFGAVTVTGQVQSVVEHRNAHPKNWSVTLIEATRG
jgi:hypothetical protein